MEQSLWGRGTQRICGIDEAGRGPLCGPVVAGAVCFAAGHEAAMLEGLDDSKRLSSRDRERLFDTITQQALGWSVAVAEAGEIDRINIRQATLLAMKRAVEGLPEVPQWVLVDGRDLPPGLPCPGQAVVKGDALSLSVAAASVLAKVWRDRIMDQLAERFPGYGWERNRGYPTADHLAALKRLGATPQHRRSYAPVKALLDFSDSASHLFSSEP
ncbi:MAG: ribonuclease HII [Magnetococcales bacterium]|nr:ribonuclease HII [Magnetococcales bacterium]